MATNHHPNYLLDRRAPADPVVQQLPPAWLPAKRGPSEHQLTQKLADPPPGSGSSRSWAIVACRSSSHLIEDAAWRPDYLLFPVPNQRSGPYR